MEFATASHPEAFLVACTFVVIRKLAKLSSNGGGETEKFISGSGHLNQGVHSPECVS